MRLDVTDHAERGTSEVDFKPFSEVVYVVLPVALLHTSPLYYSCGVLVSCKEVFTVSCLRG